MSTFAFSDVYNQYSKVAGYNPTTNEDFEYDIAGYDLDKLHESILIQLDSASGLWLIGYPNPVYGYTPYLYTITQAVGEVSSVLDIPHYLEEALELLVGFYLMNTLATSNEFTSAADNIYARYVANIQATQDRMLLRTYSAVEPTVTDYCAKGWV